MSLIVVITVFKSTNASSMFVQAFMYCKTMDMAMYALSHKNMYDFSSNKVESISVHNIIILILNTLCKHDKFL